MIYDIAEHPKNAGLPQNLTGNGNVVVPAESKSIKRIMNNGFNLDILQALYDSEINCKLEWLWDGGIDWTLYGAGEEVFTGNARTVKDAVRELAQAVLAHYPDSDFAKKYPITHKEG
jgi:hypothetical protein